MCGIAGWVKLNSDDHSPNSQAVLRAMCETIVHRGPDSEGLWTDDRAALGMRRLSIIDLHTGDQPVFSCDGSVVVMMNGELYNYREARADLEQRGHTFVTNTDTEILPHLYEEHGDALVDHINGMFAFALWDARRQRLLIARDRFGEKPLYYGVFSGRLLYASEPKALLAHPTVNREIDLNALRHYVSFDYVPAPMSIYSGIRKLSAGHLLIVENGSAATHRYWNLSWKNSDSHGRAASTVKSRAAELKEILSDSVRMRLVSDVPLGVLLSGGIDSSTIAAIAARHASEKVKTFSIGFAEDSFDESKFARLAARHIGSEHHEEILSAEAAADLVAEIGTWLDEPLSDGSLIPTYMLSRFVRKHVTVALGGDGGDELFAGYPMYYAHRVASWYRAVPSFIRNGLIEPVVNSLPVSTKNMSFDYKAKRFVAASQFDAVTRHHSWFGSFSIDQHDKLLTSEVLDATSGDIYKGARQLLESTDAPTEIEQMQFVDLNFYMAEDILTKVDRAAMAVSLETRAPFLDPRVARFAASVPLEYKLKGSSGKYILKEAVKDLLPAEIINRPKKGFGIPIAEWLKGRLNPLLRDMLAPDRLKSQGLFNVDFVETLIKEHETGAASRHKELWTLLVFQLWVENFLTPNRAAGCKRH